MNITLTNTEFNEAIQLYLDSIGFNTEKYDIETRVVVGRGGNETRAEITLDKKTKTEQKKLEEYLDNVVTNEPPFETGDIPTDPVKRTVGDIFKGA